MRERLHSGKPPFGRSDVSQNRGLGRLMAVGGNETEGGNLYP
jgi:hypothetical protein